MPPVFRFESRHIFRQLSGWGLLVIGAINLLIPGIPSSPFFAAGALLLAPYIRAFRRFAAWMHLKFPTLRKPLRRFRLFKTPPRPPLKKSGTDSR